MDFEEGFLVGIILVLGAISFLMLSPFIGYVIGAALLAFVLHPVHRKFRRLMGERLSAFILVVLAVALAIVPLLLAGAALVEDAQELTRDINTTDLVNITRLEQRIQELTGQRIDLERQINSAISRFTNITAGGVSRAVTVAMNALIGISLMLFLLYYLLKDGHRFVAWFRSVTPLPGEVQDTLHENVRVTTWAVIKGHVLIAITQGIVGGIGLAIAGVPNHYFWTFIMVLLGFIPVVGAFLVWMPASIYLFLANRPGAAVFLFIYGAIVTGSVDNFLRPIIVDRSAKINPAVILIGVMGGVYLFGAAGLFIGPVILGVLKATLNVFKNNYSSHS